MFWSPLGVAILCGTLIGLERQLRGKAVGIRTSILICVATEMFVRLGVILGANTRTRPAFWGRLLLGWGS
jgi:putative Mg2+ transporter-C (MgtC) family protein